MEQFIWVEKYRPKTVDECILTDELAKTFNSFVSKGIPKSDIVWWAWSW